MGYFADYGVHRGVPAPPRCLETTTTTTTEEDAMQMNHPPIQTGTAVAEPKKPKWVECLEKAEDATRQGMVEQADRWIKIAELYQF